MSALWTDIQSERKLREKMFRCHRDMSPGPVEADVTQLLLPGIFIFAAAMVIVHGDGRIVIPGDAGNPPLPDQRNHLVGPGSITHQVSEVVHRIYTPLVYVGQRGFQRWKIGVDVRHECVTKALSSHQSPRRITLADAGHASWNSTELCTPAGT